MQASELIHLEKNVILNTYNRPSFVVDHGKGCFLYDSDGKAYLDCVSGIAVCALGHAHDGVNEILKKQAEKLWHCSNLYYTEPQVNLANLLVENTFADKVFFCNSGSEANEGAIKFARKWGKAEKGDNCFEIVAMEKSFHGRTYGSLSATGQPYLQEGFQPMLPGFSFATFNDLESVKNSVTEHTCAILVEPVQGEGGIYPADAMFLKGLRELCDEQNILLIFDEIQCGFGRTGAFSAYEQFYILPDIMTNAKPIANGLPLGTILLTDAVAKYIEPGNHGTTFGGGPLVCAVADYVLQTILAPGFLDAVHEKGEYLKAGLLQLQDKFDQIVDVRGLGLMLAVELKDAPQPLIAECAKQGLLICKTGGNAVRFLPPLIIENKELDAAVEKFAAALQKI